MPKSFRRHLARQARAFVVIFTILAINLLASSAHAHPHMWVDYYIDAVANKDGIIKLKFRWSFDEMFTTMVQGDFNIKAITPHDVVTLRDHAFANLKNYHYYTNITADGVAFTPQETSDFDAKLNGKNLEYTFTITLPHASQSVDVSLFDPEFYVDIGPPMTKPNANKPGIMAGATSAPKPFVTSSADKDAAAPECVFHMGKDRISETWGAYPMFIVSCHVKN